MFEASQLPEATLARVREVVRQAAANPGVPVEIPRDLFNEIDIAVADELRDEILAIRQREQRFPTSCR